MSQTGTERSFERRFSVAGPVVLDLNLDAGAVRVVPGEPGKVEVRGILRGRTTFLGLRDIEGRIDAMAANPPVQQDGNTIRIAKFLDGMSVLVELTVPPATSIRAQSDSADLHVRGIAGPVEAETDHGHVEATGIEGEVRIETDHGRIEIRGVQGSVSLRSDSGSIEVAEIGGRIDARTDSGWMVLSQTTAAPIRAESDSGDITIRLAGGSGYDLSAETDHGSILIAALDPAQDRGQRIREKIRGGGPPVEARTDHGDIEIE